MGQFRSVNDQFYRREWLLTEHPRQQPKKGREGGLGGLNEQYFIEKGK